MPIHIKNFGNNTTCNDITELKSALEKYIGTSVTIIANKKNYFVTVQNDGSLVGTYDERAIDLKIFSGAK